MHLVRCSIGLLLLAWSANAIVYKTFGALPQISFDYVIVGAGTAGNVLANRLTENSAVNVLVIEAGPSDEDVLPAIAPLLAPGLANSPYDWNYTTLPQEGMNNRIIPYNRGRLLGGSSSANYFVHQSGSSDDYDKLASITGDRGWSWTNMRRYVYEHENFVKPSHVENAEKRYVPEEHGNLGMLPISLPSNPVALDDLVISATRELSDKFPYNPDTSGGTNLLGIGWVQQSIANGTRSSSSTTYLRSANARPNLFILIETQALKLLPTGYSGVKPAFRGVLLSSENSTPGYVFATREVILSAGTIGTPQLLLLSGIGPQKDLERHGIRTIVDKPSVGRNFSDHVLVPYWYDTKGLDTLDDTFRQPALMQAAIGKWMDNRTGVIANGGVNQMGFFRFQPNSSIFDLTLDPASGPKAPHWQMLISNFWNSRYVPIPNEGRFITFCTTLISPVSRGIVELASSNPLDKPIIDPRYLTNDYDKQALRDAARTMRKFASAKVFSDYIISPAGGSAGETDEALDDHIQNTADMVFHAVGTSSMSPENANWGVVDSTLRVKGTDGLRVIDASVWPFVPSVHTQGPTYLVALRGADIILEEHKPKTWSDFLLYVRTTWSSCSSALWRLGGLDNRVEF
ncbi:hypothetical protein CPB83DRAFT_850043 [Crepidotus variabilis]|uniref:pyranose dehydrogenase (acceptor) n=1 Tax=Crepidotus variabilis TaxID=179855 RepID=A0A9P6EJS9_9AGAR|nr:hypothetical protein CPB83DRAFT_850043 [Crepidotus variabilis]